MNNTTREVRRLCAGTGLTVKELAVAINASVKSVYKWLNGKTMPDATHLLKILELNKSCQDLQQDERGD